MKKINREKVLDILSTVLAGLIVLVILTSLVVFCYKCDRAMSISRVSVEYRVEVTYLDDTKKVFTYRASPCYQYGLSSTRDTPAPHVNVGGGMRYKPEFNVKDVKLLSKKNVL